MKRKVVIIGHGYTSRLCVIRSVAQLGCEITVVVMTRKRRFSKKLNTTKPIDCYSKYVNNVLYCKSDTESLVQLLLSKCADSQQKVILIPDSDFSAAAIDSHQDQLKSHFLFPHINHRQGAIVEWMNKEKQKSLAREVGLKVADSTIVEVVGGKYILPENIHYPCFTKTRSYVKNCKQTLKRCDNEKELRDFLDSIGKRRDLTILIEDFKEIETEYAVLGFSDGKEVVIPGVIQILALAHGGHFGVACTGKIMPIKGFETLVEKFKSFILQIGFVGVFDIDFYLCGGEFYFGELNLRIGGSCYVVTKMGVNLPGMLVKYLYGDNMEGMQKEIVDYATYVNERMCVDDWMSGYISKKKFNQLIKTSDISFVDDDADAMPKHAFDSLYHKNDIFIWRSIRILLRLSKLEKIVFKV